MRYLILLGVFLTGCLFAQNPSPIKPFGQVTVEDLRLEKCPFDSTAGAMILFDKGEATMDITHGLSFKRHVRIKIFKKETTDKWATKTVYYSSGDENFSKFKASTYNLVNGNVVETKIDEEALFKGKFDKFTNQARFTLPQVNDGSVLEYTYSVSSRELYGPPAWQFQYDIPVAWSEYITTIPSYFTFQKDIQGFLFPTVIKGKGETETLFLKNVPAFKPEPHMSSEENYISRLRLYVSEIWVPGELVRKVIKSWGSVAASVYESELCSQIRGSGFLKKIAEEHTAGLTEPDKKVSAIYDYVKKNIVWNDVTDVLPDRQFKEVLDSKKGSSSEINGILISLLKKSDIDAEPVLVRTRDKGAIKPFLPVFSQFNDVICCVKIGDKAILLDATHQELPQHILPERCLNGQGFLVAKEIYKWEDLTTSKSRRSVNLEMALDESGALSGKIIFSRDGVFGSTMRKAYKIDGEEKYLKDVVNANSWEIIKSTFENIDDTKSPAKEVHELILPNGAQAAGSMIYLNPIMVERMEENPFRLEKRDYPIDFGAPFDVTFMAKITLPAGYIVEELPKPKIMLLPEGGGRYTYNVTVTGNNIINVVSQMTINKASFSTEQYLNVREFYTQIVAKQAEQIVLKKQ
jgi:hypothetical protein